MAKKVLMLLSNPFRPDPRVHREARALTNAGYRVTIICWDRDMSGPSEETVDGILVKRVGPRSSFEDSKEFVKTLPKFWKQARQLAFRMDYDIVHAHDLDTLSPGLKIARKRKVPIVYDSHELYHEMAAERLSGALVKFLRAYERRMVRKPDALITVNDKLAEIFRGYGASDVQVIMNCHPDVKVEPARTEELRRSISSGGKPIALYIGVLEPNRQLLELARSHASSPVGDFILAFGGYGSLARDIESVSANSQGKVRFLGRVQPSDVPAYNRAADLLFATYDPSFKNNRIGAPNKLFEAMKASRPLVVTEGTFAGEVVSKTGCGETAPFEAIQALKVMARVLANPRDHARYSENGRKAYEEQYNWPVMEKRLLALYSRLLG